jgi:hypothetical protein
MNEARTGQLVIKLKDFRESPRPNDVLNPISIRFTLDWSLKVDGEVDVDGMVHEGCLFTRNADGSFSWTPSRTRGAGGQWFSNHFPSPSLYNKILGTLVKSDFAKRLEEAGSPAIVKDETPVAGPAEIEVG